LKIYINKIKEDWIIDRLVNEWRFAFPGQTTSSLKDADIIWIIAPWTWKKISKRALNKKKIICSIYHIDENTFDYKDFYDLDKFVHQYHVISEETKKDLSKLTDKKIISIPFWINENNFYMINDKNFLRTKYGFNHEHFILGSFQRDTEGKDLVSPKLIKGPDIFIKIAKKLNSSEKNLVVVLAGTRRQYVIKNLIENNINYKYFEMTSLKSLNELYNILDLYLVTSRKEGGPQAILECAISKTPIMSTHVGVAPEILKPSSIFNESNFNYSNTKIDLDYNFENASKYLLDKGINLFFSMFKEFYEN